MSMFEVGQSRFRALALAEGLSFVVLLFVAMPLKYLADMPMGTRYVGWAHGLLFVLYEIAILDALGSKRWPLKRVLWGALAGFVPFGTFVFLARVRREDGERELAQGAQTP